MKKTKKKLYLQKKRRYLQNLFGTSEKPRLSVFRSHRHIYAQLIDDTLGQTLASDSTLTQSKRVRSLEKARTLTPKELAYQVGQTLGTKALLKGVKKSLFDCGERFYHGRIAQVADGARQAGLSL